MHYTLTTATEHDLATDLLLTHLALTDYGRSCPATTLLSVVFAVCARLTSVFAATLGLQQAPSTETARQTLRTNRPALDLLERRCNRALHASLPRLRGRCRRLAIDLTLVP